MMEGIRKFRARWIAWGVVVSGVCALIYMACYGNFDYMSEVRHNSFIESEDNLSWLLQNGFLLYHDLQQKNLGHEVSYAQLYMKPQEDCEWVLGSVEEPPADEEFSESAETNDDSVRKAYEARNQLEAYFFELENNFDQMNQFYDYWMEDLETGEVVSNLPQEPVPQGQKFFLAFLFDENGNITVGEQLVSEDVTALRKSANFVIRGNLLEKHLQDAGGWQDGSWQWESFFSLDAPRNCRLIFCIDSASWEQMQREGVAVYTGNGMALVDGVSFYRAYADAGFGAFLMIMAFGVGILAFFLPVCGKSRTVDADRWCSLPLEMICALFFGVTGLMGSECMMMSAWVASGEAAEDMGRRLYGASDLADFIVYGSNFLIILIFFLLFWYMGMNFRQLRQLGIWGYIKKRSLIYRFFPFIKSKLKAAYRGIEEFDVTKNAHGMILKIVLINGIVIFAISAVWVAGFPVAVVYSLGLYVLLRKYISDLQKKYGILLNATNKIAEGNLNVKIPENLGVFEPFKPQLFRIQNGFSKAVEEEVKSQRMKAELITNVSHDLKTPLTAIITYIDLLKDENITEEQRKEYLETLERKSLRLKALIEDLFEVSKANSQNMILNLQDVDIVNLVKQVAFEMEDKMLSAGLDVRLKLPEEKVVLSLDSQKTYRIYENLFGNIAKYAMPGTRVYVDGVKTKDGVMITLKNITAQEITVSPQELTERFVRGDASRNTEGSGLGLAIAQGFTRLQGGDLFVELDGDLFKVTTIFGDGGVD